MPALVPELVNMASDPAISTADLLRRALVVAQRLGASELTEWFLAELNGYPEGSDVPSYRKLIGTVHRSPGKGGEKALPVDFAPRLDELMRVCAEEHVRHSVSVLEAACTQQGDKVFISTFPHVVNAETQRLGNFLLGRTTTPSQYRGILDAVRTKTLVWALDLEGRNIIGEGMSFTPQEKQAVQEQHYYISNVSGSQIQIGSSGSTQTQANTTDTDIDALKGLIQALGAVLEPVQGEVANELKAELAALKAMAESPKPKWAIIKATARSIKTVAEGVTGNILAGLAQPHMAILLALAG